MSSWMTTDLPCWYAIRTHPNQENRAESNLNAWKVETFLPRVKECRVNRLTGKPSSVIKSLFPCYLFARFAMSKMIYKVRYTRGVHSVVSVGGIPVPVDDQVITIIGAQVDSNDFVRIGGELLPGTKVLIQAGPFKGLTGIFELETSAADRVKILLDCVAYQARIEVERKYIRALASEL